MLVLTLSITVVSILGGLSALLILGDYEENIGIGYDDADFDVDFDNATGDLIIFNFTLPVNLTNAGYFDLEDLNVELEIAMRYEHINLTLPGQNDTVFLKFFEKEQYFGTIKQGDIGFFNFTGDMSNIIAFPNATKINWFRTPPPDLEFFANFTISLTYSLGLHDASFVMLNLSVGDYSLP